MKPIWEYKYLNLKKILSIAAPENITIFRSRSNRLEQCHLIEIYR